MHTRKTDIVTENTLPNTRLNICVVLHYIDSGSHILHLDKSLFQNDKIKLAKIRLFHCHSLLGRYPLKHYFFPKNELEPKVITWFFARSITDLVTTPKGWTSWSKSFWKMNEDTNRRMKLNNTIHKQYKNRQSFLCNARVPRLSRNPRFEHEELLKALPS